MSSRKRQRQDVTTSSSVHDLMVPIPKESTSVQLQDFLQRLGSTGFTHAALTHTVYGMPRPDVDEATTTIPESLWQQPRKDAKKLKVMQQQTSSKPPAFPPVKVLRRLNAVLENLSDVAHFVRRNNQQISTSLGNEMANKTSSLLQGYDLVSVCPRTDGTFQSACKSATASDILTLDYSVGRGVQLPYRIRPTDVRAVIARNAVFEIPYGPAILNQKKRKGLIHTCRLLQLASVSCKPKVILSSGSRLVVDLGGEETDGGSIVFRTPADLINMMEVVMKFDRRLSFAALHTAGTFALQQAQLRRFGKQSIAVTEIAVKKESELLKQDKELEKPDNNGTSKSTGAASKQKEVKSPVAAAARKGEASNDDDSADSSNHEENVKDGFISF